MSDRKGLMALIARNMPNVPSVLADKILGSRWLAEHDRQVAERAWDEGQRAGLLRADFEYGAIGYQHVKGNPYTKGADHA